MSSPDIQKLQDGLRAAKDAVLSAIEGVSEEEAHRVPMPGEWTVAQLMAHIAEIQSFWTAKAILITREDDPNVTRTAVENDERIAAVTHQDEDSLADLTQRMKDNNDEAVTSVARIDPKDLSRLGHRGEGNPIDAGGVIQYLAGHVEEHAGQIRETVRMVRQQK